jgi:tetratricopeptide (TPR) repeat protein
MIEYAAVGDDPLVATRHLASLAISAAWGPTPVEEAIRQCEDLLAQAAADRKGQALIRCELAHLEAMRGEFERARELYRQSRATFEDLGWKVEAALISLDSGPIEMLAGDPESAERELRTDYETLNEMGERNYISTTAGFLAEALYRQDRYDEADQFASVSKEIAAMDDVVSQVLWRSVRAKVLARRGHSEDAEGLAREAVDLMSKSDSLNVQGNTFMDLGAVLRMSGRDLEAADAYGTALRLYELKGNVTSAARARAFRESCSAGTSSSLAPTS